MKRSLLALSWSLVVVACGGQTFEAAPGGAAGSGTAGSGQAGSAQGGSAQGGAAGVGGKSGSSGVSGASGSAGMPGCACATEAQCGGKNCAAGVCKDKVPGRCWDNDDCGAGATCVGASICPCDAACIVEDAPGSCKGMNTTDWSSCAKPGECLLAANTCCGTCNTPQLTNLDAVNYTKAQPHFEEVCPSPEPCPGCAAMDNPVLSAMCRAGKCDVIDVTKDAISACKVDTDCALHAANQCCNCTVGAPDQYVAIAANRTQDYELDVCGPGAGPCNLKCASQFPAGISAKCGASGHCEVAAVKPPAAVCPTAMPQGGPCPLVGLSCEYGESVAIQCRSHAVCEASGWSVSLSGCPPLLTPGKDGCPATVNGQGGACTQEGAVCQLAQSASCLCTGCNGGGPCSSMTKWVCAKAGTSPCPAAAPNFGQPCTTDGQSCSYGVNCGSTGATRKCAGGVWTDVLTPCPQ